MTTPLSRRAATILVGGLLAIGIPTIGVTAAPQQASAAGDVCDICAITFDLIACESLGGWAYDSTLEAPPPAISGGGVPAPAPEAPAAPAAPAPAPASPGTNSAPGTPSDGAAPAAPAWATAPLAPAKPLASVKGQSVTISWAAPADGGSAVTGYRVALNGGTAIDVAAPQTSYTIKLAPGSYTATVIAVNDAGASVASPVSAKIVVDVLASSAPTTEPEVVAATSENDPTAAIAGGGILALLTVGAVAALGIRAFRRQRRASADTPTTP